jgi:putative transposase
MSRHARISPDGFVQHVINRGDHRETIFHKAGDFAAFLRIIADATLKVPMRILAYCIMRNHFHLLLWPHEGVDLPAYIQVLMNLHIQRYLQHYPPSSNGHIYQGRYRNVLVQDGAAVHRVARYIEANPLAAGVARRAEAYAWSSLSPRALDVDRPILYAGAEGISRTSEWIDFVNEPVSYETTARIQQSIRRGMPYGDNEWLQRVVAQHGLEHTLREPGRPRVYESVLS